MIARVSILSILFTLTLSYAFGQSLPYDSRLLSKFSKDELQTMDPQSLDYWNTVASKGFRIAQNFKTDSDMKEIELDDWNSTDFNMFSHGLEPMETHVQTFSIKGTDQYLQILSKEKIKALSK